MEKEIRAVKEIRAGQASDKPVIFRDVDRHLGSDILTSLGNPEVIDKLDSWIEELAEIRQVPAEELKNAEQANWVYFPWAKKITLLPVEQTFLEILYSRNFPIISKELQQKLTNTKVAVAGLSVGSNIADELVRLGIMHIAVADKDVIAGSNVPRLRSGNVLNIGEEKSTELVKRLYEINPYSDITVFDEGITEENADRFVKEADIVVDEIDSFPIKLLLRKRAREYDKPLLMATDVGLMEERIDVEGKNRPFFGGRIDESKLDELLLTPPKDKAKATKRFLDIMGEDMPDGTLQNFINILEGKQTYWSQAALTCSSGAANIAALVVRIANGEFETIPATIRGMSESPDTIKNAKLNHLRELIKK